MATDWTDARTQLLESLLAEDSVALQDEDSNTLYIEDSETDWTSVTRT